MRIVKKKANKSGRGALSKLLVGGGVVAAGALLAVNINGKKVEWPLYEAENILDGDTFFTKEGLMIRLAAVDAPEKSLCGGQEAAAALKEMIAGKPLYIRAVAKDRYGRLLSYVYTERVLVNEEMLRQGLAQYDSPGALLAEEMKAAVETARQKEKGIFGQKCTQEVNLEKPECAIKGNVALRDSRKIYRTPECAQYKTTKVQLYRGESWFCTEEEAKQAGFVKGSECFEKTWK